MKDPRVSLPPPGPHYYYSIINPLPFTLPVYTPSTQNCFCPQKKPAPLPGVSVNDLFEPVNNNAYIDHNNNNELVISEETRGPISSTPGVLLQTSAGLKSPLSLLISPSCLVIVVVSANTGRAAL